MLMIRELKKATENSPFKSVFQSTCGSYETLSGPVKHISPLATPQMFNYYISYLLIKAKTLIG